MVDRVIRVGTRGSRLARVQTQLVVDQLRACWPSLPIELVPISTGGDRSQATNRPSADWGSGVFTKELDVALLRGEIDLAVHSLKDVPPLIAPELALAAVPRRADPRDVLVTVDGRGLDALPAGARIGTSSARRVAFLQRATRADLDWQPIRGNVETRLRKLHEGQYDGLLLARAGLLRLGLEVPQVVLEPTLLPPAPGQGALGIETRADDRQVRSLVEPLDDAATAAAVRAERHLMALLEGGCRLPVGALATPAAPDGLDLLGGLVDATGRAAIDQVHGQLAEPEALAEALAARLSRLVAV